MLVFMSDSAPVANRYFDKAEAMTPSTPESDRIAQVCAPVIANASGTADPSGKPYRWSSRDLLGPWREVEIDHEGMTYRLRLTTLGKLILTK